MFQFACASADELTNLTVLINSKRSNNDRLIGSNTSDPKHVVFDFIDVVPADNGTTFQCVDVSDGNVSMSVQLALEVLCECVCVCVCV